MRDGRLVKLDACTKCLDGREHPWHDNGEFNMAYVFDSRNEPPTHMTDHLEETMTYKSGADPHGEIGHFTGDEMPAQPAHWAPKEDFYEVKDSGKREVQETGAVRDTEEGKLDWSNLFKWFEPMGTRFVAHMTKGRDKYPDPEPGVPNWTLFPATRKMLARTERSFDRHVKQYRRGDTDEDHAAAIIFNLNLAEDIKARIEDEELAEDYRNWKPSAILMDLEADGDDMPRATDHLEDRKDHMG